MPAEWIVPVRCGDESHSVVLSADGRSVVMADHRREAATGSSCALAADVLRSALEAATDVDAAVAACVFYLRQARRAHPRGDWDDGHRWYPDEVEWRDCCENVRPPSRAWPWSLMVHDRTAVHVAALYGIDPKLLRRLHRAIVEAMGPADAHREE